MVNSTITGNSSSNSSSGSSQQQSSSMMAPISVMLPSLSPLPGTNSEESSGIATLIPSTTTTPTMPVVPAPLPTTCIQPPTVVTTVLEGETPVDIDAETISMYSPVYTTKDAKSQLLMQIQSRSNSHSSQSPLSVRNYQQMQVSMPSLNLFEPVEQLEQQHASQINGKRLNHASSVSRQQKRHKSQHEQLCQSSQDFPTSTSIQVEATTTSSPYPHFGDISWSNCHPEPLAVSRWLRISSSRKQYNFNIHWHKTPPTPGWGPCAAGVVCLPLYLHATPFFFIVAHVIILVIVATQSMLRPQPVEGGRLLFSLSCMITSRNEINCDVSPWATLLSNLKCTMWSFY